MNPHLELGECFCCAYYITLKEDNFVVLQVVYETENSKVMTSKEPRLGYSGTHITLTVRCNDCQVTS